MRKWWSLAVVALVTGALVGVGTWTVAAREAGQDDARVAHLQREVARLTRERDAASAALVFYEDGSWVMGDGSGCAPSALCDD